MWRLWEGVLEGGEAPKHRLPGLPLCKSADAHSISFLHNPRYQQPQLAQTQAACVIVAPAMREAALAHGACITTPDPYAYFARLTQLWQAQQPPAWPQGVDSELRWCILEARVDPSASVGPHCTIERGAVVGADGFTRPGAHWPRLHHLASAAFCIPAVGDLVPMALGLPNKMANGKKIEQLGAVVIGDDVEIGANTCIDRGALDDTVIADGVKIDNLVQIAHNVKIGAHTVIAGNTGIAGSAKIGAIALLVGAANILGHLQIADGTSISPTSMVTRSIHKPDLYWNFPNSNQCQNGKKMRLR